MMERMSAASRLPRLTLPSAALLVLALGAAMLTLFMAPIAYARIVPQRGIGDIDLGMTRAEVVRTKGKPDGERLVRNEIIGPQRMVRYGKTRAFFGGFRRNAAVVTVNTRDPAERTRSGVGVGSTVAEVRRGVRGIACRNEFGFHTCFKGRFRPGERVTVFDIARRGRVSLVLIGFVID